MVHVQKLGITIVPFVNLKNIFLHKEFDLMNIKINYFNL